LKKKIEDYEKKLVIDKRERLYEDIQIYISGYYGAWNTQKDKKQLNKIIKSCLESCEEAWAIADIDVKHCWVGNKIKYKYAERKGRFIYYCKTKKELACLMLATAKAETNFTEDVICQNYERDSKGLYVTIYGWKIPKKKGFELILKKTTKDYGCYQINQDNFADLTVLRMLNLWTPERNEWVMNLRTNCLMRIVNYKFRNDEKRKKLYVYDLNLYNQLMRLNWGEYE